MYIHIPTGERITTTMVGRALRDVTCENCGAEYIYLVQAQATASGVNALYLDPDGAASRSESRARGQLNQQLRVMVRPVPCPKCGWYQREMELILVGRRILILALIAALPVLWLGLRWVFTSDEDNSNLHSGFWIGLSIALAFIAAIYHFTRSDNSDAAQRAARDPTSGGTAMLKTDYHAMLADKAKA